MFTYLKLKNFKSYKEITIDFQSKKDEYKHIVAIYGPNSSGKTTIAQAFLMLAKTLNTMRVKDLLMDLVEGKIDPPAEIPIKKDKMLEYIKGSLSDSTLEKIIESNKTIDSSEPMSVEYGFVVDGSPGSYLMEFDNSNLIRERLEYKINKNKGCYFDIEEGSDVINSVIFETKEFLDEIKKQVKMYWGKHSLLSIVLHEMEDKAASYVNSNISNNLRGVLKKFEHGIGYRLSEKYLNNDDFFNEFYLQNYRSGFIDKKDEQKLDTIEKVLNSFFRSLYDDVNRAFYRREYEENDVVRYRLVFSKTSEGHVFDIDFKYESTGTKEVLELLPYLMMAVKGECVVIDEFGNGIHDLLAAKLLKSVANSIKGQLIIATHNTVLMDESDLKPESLYFITTDKSEKAVRCAPDIEDRIHPSYNYRYRYLHKRIYENSLPNDFNMNYDELSKVYE